MGRYVFYNRESLDAKGVTAAKKIARALGATVLRGAAGSMLVEAEPQMLRAVARALPDWSYSAESRTHRIPERTPLQRARLAAGKAVRTG